MAVLEGNAGSIFLYIDFYGTWKTFSFIWNIPWIKSWTGTTSCLPYSFLLQLIFQVQWRFDKKMKIRYNLTLEKKIWETFLSISVKEPL